MKCADSQRGKIVLNISRDFDEIYLTYASRMCRFAETYLTKEDAENVVHDIFINMLEENRVVDIRSNIASYMFVLTKNRCLDFLRHQAVMNKRRQEYILKLEALEKLNSLELNEEDIERLIHEALDKLSPRCREIFVKSRFENKKNKDIAAEMNISVSTVETQMGIAMKKMKAFLKDYSFLIFFL